MMKRCPDNQHIAQRILTHRIYRSAFTWPPGKSEDVSPSPLPESYLDHCQIGPLQNVYKNSEPPRNLFSSA